MVPSKKTQWRVLYVCDSCGNVTKTRAKNDPKKPHRDHKGCNSTQVRKIKAFKVVK